MSVYYFVRAAVVINYVNKKTTTAARLEVSRTRQNIYTDLLLHIFGFCCFCLGGKVEVKQNIIGTEILGCDWPLVEGELVGSQLK